MNEDPQRGTLRHYLEALREESAEESAKVIPPEVAWSTLGHLFDRLDAAWPAGATRPLPAVELLGAGRLYVCCHVNLPRPMGEAWTAGREVCGEIEADGAYGLRRREFRHEEWRELGRVPIGPEHATEAFRWLLSPTGPDEERPVPDEAPGGRATVAPGTTYEFSIHPATADGTGPQPWAKEIADGVPVIEIKTTEAFGGGP